jgi:hypothetical protein
MQTLLAPCSKAHQSIRVIEIFTIFGTRPAHPSTLSMCSKNNFWDEEQPKYWENLPATHFVQILSPGIPNQYYF